MTITAPGQMQHLNNNQKIFEVGRSGVSAIATWGMASFGDKSTRTLVAEFADELEANPKDSIHEVADAWADFVWSAYEERMQSYSDFQTLCDAIAKSPNDPGATESPSMRTESEESLVSQAMRSLSVGFYVCGRGSKSREPGAYSVTLEPDLSKGPSLRKLGLGSLNWAGMPNIASRVIHGYDANLRADILESGHWTGSMEQLDDILTHQSLLPGVDLPIRDAVDYVYSCIFGTIKAMKFSQLPPSCGGSIEVAVLTTDRNFRWVKHKSWVTGIDEVM